MFRRTMRGQADTPPKINLVKRKQHHYHHSPLRLPHIDIFDSILTDESTNQSKAQ